MHKKRDSVKGMEKIVCLPLLVSQVWPHPCFLVHRKRVSLLLEYHKPIRTAESFALSADKMAVDYMMTGPDTLAALGYLPDG